ncbi:MAG: reprolysin-like metallopeptidase [Gemmataceae bacterium]
MRRMHRKAAPDLKRVRPALSLQRLEDRLNPAIAIMGPYTPADLATLNATAGSAWAAEPTPPVTTATQTSHFDAPNAWYFTLNNPTVLAKLLDAPEEFKSDYTGSFTMSLPRPDGTFQQFHVWEVSIMEPGLAALHPDEHTYRGQGIDDPTAQLSMDETALGFHAQVLSPNGRYYIDPYFHLEQGQYVAYYASDLVNHQTWECQTISTDLNAANAGFTDTSTGHPAGCNCPLCQAAASLSTVSSGANPPVTRSPSNGTVLRQYRLALAADWEYSNFFGGTVAQVHAAQITAINRVDGVYESELAVRLTLIANNDSLIYCTGNGFTSSSDPYTDGSGSTMLSQNQSNVDSVIGSANYDIGHVFSTGGGGIAGLGVVTMAGSKAQGVTGQSTPTGDSFWIDYVAHEMGHQFGGHHSFNSSVLNANRTVSTAYEPGSGSTIMSYAGLGDDYQPHSDPYFHSANLDEMTTHIAANPGSATVSTGNSIPSVNAGLDYTIPASTPFALTVASSSDADGDPLTFDWQERDLGSADLLTSADNGTSPRFRPFSSTTSPTRTFPRLSDILNNTDLTTAKTGERMFTVARTANFRVVARDNKAGGGAFSIDDMVLKVVNTGSAFAVTSPNTGVTWTAGTSQAITWNVAGTTANGINAANVNILLSTDGGLTFPTTLAANTPNDGTETVTIPNSYGNLARIKIQPTNNVFFDISDTNFTIASPNAITVTSVSPVGGSNVPPPFTQVDITFSAAIDANTVGTDDLTLSQGSVVGAQLISPQTVRYSLSGLTAEGSVTLNLLFNSVFDTLGNGNIAFNTSYTIDYGTTAFPVPLAASGVRGTLAYTGTASGLIQSATDADSFPITLDAGQSASFLLSPASTLQGSMSLTGPGGLNQTVSGSSAGSAVVMQSAPVALAGVYTLTVSSLGSTTGSYTARLELNSALENESNGGAANNSTATAQAVTGFFDLGSGADRAVVRGQTEPGLGALVNETEPNDSIAAANNATGDFVPVSSNVYQTVITGNLSSNTDADYFNIGAMQVGDVITIAMSGADGGRGTAVDPQLFLYRSGTTSAATSNDDRATNNFDALIYRYTVTVPDTYYIDGARASSTLGTYKISVYLENAGTAPNTGNGAFTETESNNTKATANNVSGTWKRATYNSTITGSIGTTTDADYFKYHFTTGDVFSAAVTSGGNSHVAIALYNAAGTLLYNEKGVSTSFGNNSAMYAYDIVTTGDYYVKVSTVNATAGTYTLSTNLATSVTPPIPASGYDYYSFTVTAGQPLALGLKGLTAGTLSFDLLDANGVLAVSGSTGSANFDQTIGFTPSSSGTWFARVGATSNSDYQVLVARGAFIDSETNDSFATAEMVTAGRVLGAITTSDDWYQFPVTAGQVITLTTATPGDGIGEFINTLDPAIELFDPSNNPVGSDDNSAGDGHNASLSKTAAATGNYRVHVLGTAGTTGEYVVSLALSDAPPQVTSSVIDDNTVQRSRVTSVTVNFSEPVTLPANPTNAFQLVRTYPTASTVTLGFDSAAFAASGNTQAILTFTGPTGLVEFGSLADGNFTLTVFANQVLDSANQPMNANYAVNFHRLFGDQNGDKTVDQNDYLVFRDAVSAGPSHVFDYDNSGDVDQVDYLAFRNRIALSLP